LRSAAEKPVVRLEIACRASNSVCLGRVTILSALRRYSIWDYVLTVLSVIWSSVPTFFFGLIGLYISPGTANRFGGW
jgi:ABC-type dipeptide/oligopeptide/nickel transport system permease component